MHASDEISELFALEAELRAKLDACRAMGWRTVDLVHSFARHDRRAAPMIRALDDGGLVLWWRRSELPLRDVIKRARLLAALASAWSGYKLPSIEDEPLDDIDASVVERVRALLAKAESTTFEAEADALNAKAQELMARHAISSALLDGSVNAGSVRARRFLIGDPYARVKFLLLAQVAEACGCRCVGTGKGRMSHVFGFPEDLAAVDLLYTSLLVQATTALAATPPPEWARSSSEVASFRRSFLVGFATRAGVRLKEVRRRTIDEVQHEIGDDLLPVIASRKAEVDAAYDEAVPSARPMSVRAGSGHGWSAGAAAGDRATFATQARVPSGPKRLGR